MYPKNLSLRNLLLIVIFVVLPFSFVSAQDDTYVIPDNPEGADPEMVIASIGDTTITLEEFFQRVRYERFLRFNLLNTVVDQAGPEILILDDPANQLAPQISQFLENIANSQSFGQQVYRSMVLERMYHREAELRGLEIEECAINQNWVGVLNDPSLQTGECEFAEGFDAAKQSFIDRAMTFSGMTEEQVQSNVRVLSEFDAVFNALGDEVELPDVETITTSHIRVAEEETAQAAMDALDAGEEWYSVMFQYTEDAGVVGGGGALPPLQRGATVAEFDAAIFDPSNEPGDLLGPIETQFGFHIIEILEQRSGRRVSHILFTSEEEAITAVQLLTDDNVDFGALAAQYSADLTTRDGDGDLGYLVPNNTLMPDAFNEAVFAAEVGQVLGPIETERGFHVAIVTEANGDEAAEIVARHILVDNAELAQELMDRINAGEDFATLANLYSLDGAGNRGDTLSIISQGQQTGAYTLEDMFEQFPALALGLRGAEQGDIVGPLNTQFGYFIVRIDEAGTRTPTAEETNVAIQNYVDAWQVEQLEGGLVDETNIWREFIVFDPMPSDVSEALVDLNIFIERSRADAEEFRVANSIPNILSRLTVRTPIIPEVEITPEVEATDAVEDEDNNDAEVTPEATEAAD